MNQLANAPALNRREFLKSTGQGIAAGIALSALPSTSADAPTKKPNILFIFADQFRPDLISSNGGTNITTPHLDRLAREGTSFTNAVATYPLCTPYRGMLQTGRYPSHSGIVLNFVEANPRQHCLAHAFNDAGYLTGFIGKWHLSAGQLKKAGKLKADRERHDEVVKAYVDANPECEFTPPGPQRLGYQHWQAYNFHMSFKRAFYYQDTPQRLIMDGYETDAETNMAIDFMKRAKNKPFFLVVAPHPPHPPFTPAAAPDGYIPQVKTDLTWAPNVPAIHPHRKLQLPARCYHAMAKNVDDNIGRLLKFLDDSGLAQDTLVVFTSDHGEMLGSQNRINKMVPYRESINLPLIFRWPGRVPADRKSDLLYGPMDHYPTLAKLAGATAPKEVDGVDLSGAVLGGSAPDREALLLMNFVSHWDYFETDTFWPEWRGIRTKTHTYARYLSSREELFDNVKDPYQLVNQVDGLKDLATLKQMREVLKTHLATAHDDFLPGPAYANWYDAERNLVKTALGVV
jgi:arylsulfatase A-like enzyme